jgi:uncharacterized protein
MAPAFFVTVFLAKSEGGGDVDGSSRVMSFTYEDDEQKPDTLKLQVDNFDLSNLDSPVWKTGNKLEISWGYLGDMSPIRSCVIQKVTGSTVLTVEANAMSVLMNKTQKTRTFKGPIKRSDVARQIALENGYEPDDQFIDETDLFYPSISCPRMTDAALLKDLARREGFEFYVDFDGFHWHKKKLGQRPLRRFVYYTDKSGDIITWNIENDIYAKKAGAITAAGINPLTKEPINATASNATTEGTALAPEKTIITGISAQDGAVTGDFTGPGPGSGSTEGSAAVMRTTETTQAGAQTQANGIYANNQLTAALISMECRGSPSTIAKTVNTIEGIGKSVSGNYYFTSVIHKVGAGYTMTVKARRDGRTSINNADAYANLTVTKPGVTPNGPVNDGKGDDKKDPNAPPPDLVKISKADGSFTYADTGGRTQATTPPATAPAGPPIGSVFNPLTDMSSNGKGLSGSVFDPNFQQVPK